MVAIINFGGGGGWSVLNDWTELGSLVSTFPVDLSGLTKSYWMLEMVLRSDRASNFDRLQWTINDRGAGYYAGQGLMAYGTDTWSGSEYSTGDSAVYDMAISAGSSPADWYSYIRMISQVAYQHKGLRFIEAFGCGAYNTSAPRCGRSQTVFKASEALNHIDIAATLGGDFLADCAYKLSEM